MIKNFGLSEEEEDNEDDEDVLGEAGCDVHSGVNDSCPNIHPQTLHRLLQSKYLNIYICASVIK